VDRIWPNVGDEWRTLVNTVINFLVTQKFVVYLREYFLKADSLRRPYLSIINNSSFSDGAECAVRKDVWKALICHYVLQLSAEYLCRQLQSARSIQEYKNILK
jgi:hypothetical protein